MSCCLNTRKTFVVKDENILRDTNARFSHKILISRIRQTCIQRSSFRLSSFLHTFAHLAFSPSKFLIKRINKRYVRIIPRLNFDTFIELSMKLPLSHRLATDSNRFLTHRFIDDREGRGKDGGGDELQSSRRAIVPP